MEELTMKKWLDEIERIKQDTDEMLGRKCIGLNSVEVVFLDTMQRFNLSEDYFQKKKSFFDPTWAGCYIVPGEITTLRQIHIRAIECDAAQYLINYYLDYHYDSIGIPEDRIKEYERFVPNLLKQ